MNIVKTRRYIAEAANIGVSESLQTRIEERIKKNPQLGTPLGGELYKVRVPYRGGARIIHCRVIRKGNDVRSYLLSIYLKSQQEDLDDADYNEARKRAARKRKDAR